MSSSVAVFVSVGDVVNFGVAETVASVALVSPLLATVLQLTNNTLHSTKIGSEVGFKSCPPSTGDHPRAG